MGEQNAQPEPLALALIVADDVYVCPATQKKSLLGMFSSIHPRSFPAVLGRFVVYAAMTDGYGNVPIQMRLVDAEELRGPLLDLSAECQFPDPRSVGELIWQSRGVSFPEPGEYRLQLFGCGALLMERRIVVGKTLEAVDE